MLKIKLQRVGKKHDPSFRVVVTDRRTGPKSNKHVAILGHYDAIRKTVNLKIEEIKNWIAKGAQPTDTVHNILVKEKVIEGTKKNVLPKKSPIIDEEKIAAEKAAAEEAKIKAEEEANKEKEEVKEESAEETKTEEAPVTEEIKEEVVEENKEVEEKKEA